jgi:hypothetical protein
MAFVTILFNVNLALYIMDYFILQYTYEFKNHALKSVMVQLLFNHILQMVFLREFYDSKGKVNTKNGWVWVIHALNYPYILYKYIECEIWSVTIDGS